MKRIYTYFLITILTLVVLNVNAQEDEQDFFAAAGIDLVSSYVWRGVAFDNAPNIQGAGLLDYKNFEFGIWSTMNLDGSYFEPNLWLAYSTNNLTVMLTDFDGGAGVDFFNYDNDETMHIIELAASYTLSDNLPLTLSSGVFFYGADKKIESYDALTEEPILGADNNYSAYLELMYAANIGANELNLTVGASTHESIVYGNRDFALINVGLNLTRNVQITDNFSLPLSFAFIANPDARQVYTVLKISI